MEDSYCLELEDSVLDAIASQEIDQIIKQLKKFIERNESQLESFLQQFCTELREEYSPDSLEVDYIDTENGFEGIMSISFNGYINSGCSDCSGSNPHWDSISYQINGKTINIKADFPDLRDPDEY